MATRGLHGAEGGSSLQTPLSRTGPAVGVSKPASSIGVVVQGPGGPSSLSHSRAGSCSISISALASAVPVDQASPCTQRQVSSSASAVRASSRSISASLMIKGGEKAITSPPKTRRISPWACARLMK